MGTNLHNPYALLAELKHRQEEGRDINDLLSYILLAVEAWVKHPEPKYWVRQQLIDWAKFPNRLESESKRWFLTKDQWAALANAFQIFKLPTDGPALSPARIER